MEVSDLYSLCVVCMQGEHGLTSNTEMKAFVEVSDLHCLSPPLQCLIPALTLSIPSLDA